MGALLRSSRATGRARAFLHDARRPESRHPRSVERVIELSASSDVRDALAPADVLRSQIVRRHPALQRLCLATWVQDEAAADGRGAEAVARLATEGRTVETVTALRDAYREEALAATIAADACDAELQRMQAAPARPQLVRGA